MAQKHKKQAAAHARAGKQCKAIQYSPIPSTSSSPEPIPVDFDTEEYRNDSEYNETLPILDSNFGSDYDCGYTGGVLLDMAESESEMDDWKECTTLEDETLSEFLGDKLVANLLSLQEELEALNKPTMLGAIMKKKSVKDWEKAEADRQFGYNGNSSHSQQRHAKEAREKDQFHKDARTSYILTFVFLKSLLTMSQHQPSHHPHERKVQGRTKHHQSQQKHLHCRSTSLS